MNCQFCGADYADTLNNCPNCGTPANQSGTTPTPNMESFQNPTSTETISSHTYTEKEFYNLPELGMCKDNIKSSAIALYVLATFNAILGLAFGSYGMFLDVIYTTILGIILQTKRSRVAAVLLVIYAAVNMIVLAIETGRPGGYLYLIVASLAVKFTFKYQKAWKEYKETGVLPNYFKVTNTKKRKNTN